MGYTGNISLINGDVTCSAVEFKNDGRSCLSYASAYRMKHIYHEVKPEEVRKMFLGEKSGLLSDYGSLVSQVNCQTSIIHALSYALERLDDGIEVTEQNGTYRLKSKTSNLSSIDNLWLLATVGQEKDAFLDLLQTGQLLQAIKIMEDKYLETSKLLAEKMTEVNVKTPFFELLYKASKETVLTARYAEGYLVIYNQNKNIVDKVRMERFQAGKFLDNAVMESYVTIKTESELDKFIDSFSSVENRDEELESMILSIDRRNPFILNIGGGY